MRYLLMLDTPFWMLLSSALGTVVYSLRRRIRALDEPQLLLPRKERRQWARDELAQRKLEENTKIIKGEF